MTISKHSSKSSSYFDVIFCAGFGLGFFLCFMAITYYRLVTHTFQSSQVLLSSKPSTRSVATTASVFSPLTPSPNSSGRLLCWVLTSPNTLWTRSKHIVKTWGRRCDTLLFLSSKPDLKFPGTVLALETEEGRENLYNKTISAFKILHDSYLDKADWFLKADDDTYVIVENLRLLLSQFSPNKPVYLGRRFRKYVPQGYMSGGAGYVLSSEAVRLYAKALYNGTCTLSTSPEDVEIGRCLQKLGVPAGDSRDHQKRETFHPLWLESLFASKDLLPSWFHKFNYYTTRVGPDCCSNASVSFHYCQPFQMYMLDYFLYHLRPVLGHRIQLDKTSEEKAETGTQMRNNQLTPFWGFNKSFT